MHALIELVLNYEGEEMGLGTWLIKATYLLKGHSFSGGQ